ncbi:MAG: SDR family NAD(P)-dependent oxidoreductase [Tenacibaculum sp.]
MQKKVIITGASRGIGFELTKKFASEGHDVLALSRNTLSIKKLQQSNITCLSVDLALEEDIKKAINFVQKHWQSVHILINNAGKLINKPFSELTAADFNEVYKVNVFGLVELTRGILSFMPLKSHVVTISSIGSVQGSQKFSGLAAYSSSKAAVIALSELLAHEYKQQQIAFNVLALGAVQTEMLEKAFPGYQAPITAQEMATYIYDFALTANKYFNGKLLQVSSTTP